MAIDEAQEFLDEGDRFLHEGKYDQAVNAYDKALAINPMLASAWYWRGIVLKDLGRLNEALNSFDKAVAINPRDDHVWTHRGTALAALGRHRQALKSYDRAIKIYATEDLAWSCRGDSLASLGLVQEAVESYEKALKLLPTDRYVWDKKDRFLNQLELWIERHRPPTSFVKLYKLVATSEERLHMFIRQKLQRHFGEDEKEWWAKGIPEPIRQECQKRREHDPRRALPYGYTDLVDLRDILYKNWQLFEEDFQRIREQVNSKKEFLVDLVRLNEIRNLVMHPVRSMPTEDDHSFADKMHVLIQKFLDSG